MSNDECLSEIWNTMSTPDCVEYKLLVFRLEPVSFRGNRMSGYLKAFHLPTTIPDIIESIGIEFGGGKYQIRIVDASGKYVKSKMFEVVGEPRLPSSSIPTLVESSPETPPDLSSIPVPTKVEMRDLLVRRTLLLLDRPGANELETLKFLH